MQNKLATWSSAGKERKFDRLLRIIVNRSWLLEAARVTLASSGAKTPGIDGIDKQAMECDLEYQLDAIRTELLAGSYQPQPARRIYIPKANGKQRPLGIPTLRDRIVQRAMLMVMEPVWESDFHRLSYGFRPERSVHHAIRTVKFQLQDSSVTKGRWVIEGDLASYFDTVHHSVCAKGSEMHVSCRCFGVSSKQAISIKVCSGLQAKVCRKVGLFHHCCQTSCSTSLINGWKQNT